MNSQKIEFPAIVGENDVTVEATFTPGRPATMPSLARAGEPAEGPELQIDKVWLLDRSQNNGVVQIDIEGLFVRKRQRGAGVYVYESIEERLIDAAFEYLACDMLCALSEEDMGAGS